MNSIFNDRDKSELLERIEKVGPANNALWGKMNVCQMLAHCSEGLKMTTGAVRPKRVPFPISIIGKLLKNKILGEGDFRRNSPTAAELTITGTGVFENEKERLLAAVNELHAMGEGGINEEVHPFFGKMTKKEWGILNYKHLDHHLRQFGA
jgi:hypothetical protein